MEKKRYRSSYTKVAGAMLLTLYAVSAIWYQKLPQKPFPLFHWNLYSLNSDKTGYYDIVVTALDRAGRLEPPVFLADLKSEYHQDWALSPFKIVQRFGRELTQGAPAAALENTHKLIDNFLIDHPYAEYDLIFTQYRQYDVFRSGKYALPSEMPFTIIRHFKKESP